MKNKLILSLLSIIFVIGASSTTVFASNLETSVDHNTLTVVSDIVDQTESLELINVDELPVGTPFVEFDSIEEFEKAVTDLENENKEQFIESKEQFIGSNEPNTKINTLATTKSDTKVLTVMVNKSWNPLKASTQPASVTVDIGYSYTGSGTTKKFSSIKKVSSYSFGFPTDWIQTSYSSPFSISNTRAKITINGYNLLGASIGGQPIGMKVKDKLTFNFDLNKSLSTVFDLD